MLRSQAQLWRSRAVARRSAGASSLCLPAAERARGAVARRRRPPPRSRSARARARRPGARAARLVERGADLPWEALEGAQTLGLSAGASAPEVLVEEVIEALKSHYTVQVETVNVKQERVTFNLPKELKQFSNK